MSLISVSESAKRMNCTVTQVYRLLNAGFLEGVRIDSRRYVCSTALQQYIDTHQRNGQLDTSIEYAKIVKNIKY